ncbi:MAG: MBL fold metallo-hydrolase [Thermoplasmata archaeon]|nr:MBL fold metallo-hydrolase [Thermoplasmata archaeon]
MRELEIDGCRIEWLGHASFRISSGSTVVYIDPFVLDADPPEADVVIATHDHFDHCHTENIAGIAGKGTRIVTTTKGAVKFSTGVRGIRAGDRIDVGGIAVSAVHAYNVNKFRAPGQPFHPRGEGIGVVVDIGGIRVYHSGDTDCIDEMDGLAGMSIDVALLPIGGKYTMDAAEAAIAVKKVRPRMVVPMHFGTLAETSGDIDLFVRRVGDAAEVVVLEQKG